MARMVPAALLAPLAAVLADRYRRERVLVGVALVRSAALGGAAQRPSVCLLSRCLPNLRAALDHLDHLAQRAPQRAIQTAGALADYWLIPATRPKPTIGVTALLTEIAPDAPVPAQALTGAARIAFAGTFSKHSSSLPAPSHARNSQATGRRRRTLPIQGTGR